MTTENRDECLTSLVDWVQFTFPYVSDLNLAYDLLGIPQEEFVDMPHGLYRYASQKACGAIRILYNGVDSRMGIHVQFSGQACREYETHWCNWNTDTWPALFDRVLRCGGQFSRLDLAIDEFRYNSEKPFFTVAGLIARVKRNLCRSKFKTVKSIQKIRIEGGENLGNTVYFGSPTSDIQCRCYEKNMERLNEGHTLEHELTTWNRFEVQLSDQRAQNAVLAIMSGLPAGSIVYGIISHYIDFVDKLKEDSNKSRWPRSAFWEDYLNGAARLRLAVKAPDRTIPQKESWLIKQVYPTFAEVWVAHGCPGEDYLAEILTDGMERMSEQQWERAEQFFAHLKEQKEKMDAKKRVIYEQKEERRMEQILKNRNEKRTRANEPSDNDQ